MHIVRWPKNNEAPFDIKQMNGVYIYERNDETATSILKKINEVAPAIVICAGWVDKEYWNVVKKLPYKTVKVITMDNHWKGNVKQWLGRFYARLFITPLFDYCWVPGNSQTTYAAKLGFKSNQIKKGFYCADVNLFNTLFDKDVLSKKNKFPHRFIYAGRYVDYKGLNDLWQAFSGLKNEKLDWELGCIGTGLLEP